jgi:hypothetical protein
MRSEPLADANADPVPNLVPLSPDEPIPQPDDIKIEYHPNSNCPTEIYHFAEYGKTATPPSQNPPPEREPWKPFRSRLDFEFAEFSLDAALNKEQTNTLIRLVRKALQQPDDFTLASHGELNNMWQEASIASIPVGILVVL